MHPTLCRYLATAALVMGLAGCDRGDGIDAVSTDTLTIKIATINIEDVRTEDVQNPDHPRLKRVAEIIRRLRPDVILLNEIAYDQPDAPYVEDDQPPGLNAQWFANNFLNILEDSSGAPLHYHAFMAPTNTGIASGHDLNNDGRVVADFPDPPGADDQGRPGPQTTAGRLYGNDCLGFGTFPGQYGMGLLVDEQLRILSDQVRTFQHLPWNAMPDALLPTDPATEEPWYSASELEIMPLSSKSHWDVPVRLRNGAVIHLLCSHPTPPAFDGTEQRNKRRNHDEIRFWGDYLSGAEYIVDDKGKRGGLAEPADFVILGDQNADPDEGGSMGNPIGRFLFEHPRVNGEFVPTSTTVMEGLDPDDTAGWGLRVDYVIPSVSLPVEAGGVWRYAGSGIEPVSDHFPVWISIMAAPAKSR